MTEIEKEQCTTGNVELGDDPNDAGAAEKQVGRAPGDYSTRLKIDAEYGFYSAPS